MADVTVNSNLRNASGQIIELLQPSYVPDEVLLAAVPDASSGRKVPLTDGSGKLYEHQMPGYLLPENLPDGMTEAERQALKDEVVEDHLTPPVTLTLLFDNALA